MEKKRLICGAMILFSGLTWLSVTSSQAQSIREYNELIEKAQSYSEKGISIDAAKCYAQAIEMNPSDYDLYVKLYDEYEKLDDRTGMEQTFEKGTAVSKTNEDLYVRRVMYFIEKESYEEAFGIIDTARENTKSDRIEELYDSIEGMFDTAYISANEVRGFYNGYAAFENGGLWGLYDTKYRTKIKAQFEEIGGYSNEEEIVPVKMDGEWYYVDIDGNRKRVSDKRYEFLGTYASGYAPARSNGYYGYVDPDFKEFNFEYDYAGVFENDIAAVKKGDKWAIISSELTLVTDYIFDDIKMDRNGVCSYSGVFFASQNGKYALYDTKGKQIGNQTFDDAKVFLSDSYAAVCQNGKWGYVSKKGDIAIDAKYDDANSFSAGLAPVKLDDKWAYISDDGSELTEYIFSYAEPVNSLGKAVVEEDYGLEIASFYTYEKSK